MSIHEPFEYRNLFVHGGMILESTGPAHTPGRDSVYLARCSRKVEPQNALVIGCGIGLLPLELAARGTDVVAIDINPHATELCVKNAVFNDLNDKVHVITSDARTVLNDLGKFDLVISNPPQLPGSANKAVDDRWNWVDQANEGGEDGLGLIRWICENTRGHLRNDGCLMFTHFDFLDIESTVNSLRNQAFLVHVDPGVEKQLGVMSSERLRRLGYTRDSYWVRVVHAWAR